MRSRWLACILFGCCVAPVAQAQVVDATESAVAASVAMADGKITGCGVRVVAGDMIEDGRARTVDLSLNIYVPSDEAMFGLLKIGVTAMALPSGDSTTLVMRDASVALNDLSTMVRPATLEASQSDAGYWIGPTDFGDSAAVVGAFLNGAPVLVTTKIEGFGAVRVLRVRGRLSDDDTGLLRGCIGQLKERLEGTTP